MTNARTARPLTAIFLEPTGSLLATIRERKMWLEAQMPRQPYSAHPPHCTVLFGDYGPVQVWQSLLAARLAAFPSFEIETVGWHVFANDTLTGGGQTVALRAVASPALLSLQTIVAETVAPFSRNAIAAHPLALREPFATSLRHYGYPFVGPHWIPHFTIGSPQVPEDAPFVGQIQAAESRHRFTLECIGIWNVVGEAHNRIDMLPLSNTRSRGKRSA